MEVNKYIDHTLLRASATYDKVETLYAEAKGHDFANVCANSYWVLARAELLKGTDIEVYIAMGFPLGAMSTKTKAFETAATIADGAEEIDMVLNIGEMKTKHYDAARADAKAVVETAEGNCVKIILENCLLTKGEIVRACEFCVEAGVAFVKTSTGFSTGGATPEDVELMKDTVKKRCLVRAAGRVHCYEDMEKTVEVGADRIGTSAGVKLMQEGTSNGGY